MRNILVGVPITYLFTHQPLYQRNKIWCDFKVRCKLEWETCWRVCFYCCKALRTSFQILSFPKCWCILRALEKSGHLFWYLEVRGQMFSNISFSQELLWKRCRMFQSGGSEVGCALCLLKLNACQNRACGFVAVEYLFRAEFGWWIIMTVWVAVQEKSLTGNRGLGFQQCYSLWEEV